MAKQRVNYRYTFRIVKADRFVWAHFPANPAAGARGFVDHGRDRLDAEFLARRKLREDIAGRRHPLIYRALNIFGALAGTGQINPLDFGLRGVSAPV